LPHKVAEAQWPNDRIGIEWLGVFTDLEVQPVAAVGHSRLHQLLVGRHALNVSPAATRIGWNFSSSVDATLPTAGALIELDNKAFGVLAAAAAAAAAATAVVVDEEEEEEAEVAAAVAVDNVEVVVSSIDVLALLMVLRSLSEPEVLPSYRGVSVWLSYSMHESSGSEVLLLLDRRSSKLSMLEC
jgi:hypothetical protein